MNGGEDTEELLELAVAIAREAGALLDTFASSANRQTLRKQASTKTSLTDLATEADRASETLIVDAIRAARPDDAVIAEEGAAHKGSSGMTWVIDPLDGTTNFVYGFAPSVVSIAAEADGRALVGVVYDPARDELFSAALGKGAWCNDEPIFTGERAQPLAQALIGTGFSYSPDHRLAQARLLETVLPNVRDIRRAGAAAADLCSVAIGRLDGYYESGLQPWDRAAGVLIASEAGLFHADLDEIVPAGKTLVVAPPFLFSDLVDLLRRAAIRA